MVNFNSENGCIFPRYPNTSGSHASHRKINMFNPVIMAILTQERVKIESAFKTLSKSREQHINVDMPLDWALER